MSRFGAVAGWVGQVFSWLVILGIGAVITVSVLIPRIAGATPYTILTGSMRPAMPPGTMVVVKPEPIESIGVGSVITYQLRSGDPMVVTHRVTAVGINGKGEYRFTTKGDANNVADATPVMPVQIRGVRWYYIPYLGYATNVLTGSEHQIAVGVVAALLVGYAGVMFLGSARDRRRRKQPRRQGQQSTEKTPIE